MNAAGRTIVSIWASICSGCVFAVIAAIGVPEALIFFEVVLFIGGTIGLITSPAAVYALALPECRPSFAVVVTPTCAVAFAGSVLGGPGVAIVATALVYVVLCLVVGTVALRRRKHLEWFFGHGCPGCGYDMRGLEGGTCPECGKGTSIKPRWRVPLEVMRP